MKAVFKPSRIIREATSPTSEAGRWTLRISFTTADLCNIKVKPKLIQLSSILEVHSWLFLQRSMLLFRTNGELISRTLIARVTKLSAKFTSHANKPPRNSSQSDSKSVRPFSSWSQWHTSTRVKESANLLSLRTHLTNTIMVTSFSVTYFWSTSTQFMILIRNSLVSASTLILPISFKCTLRVAKEKTLHNWIWLPLLRRAQRSMMA